MPLLVRHTFEKLKTANFKIEPEIKTFVLEDQNILLENLEEDQLASLNSFLQLFKKTSQKKGTEVGRSQSKLDSKFGVWLSSELSPPQLKQKVKSAKATPSKGGRPKMDFSQLSKRSRDRETEFGLKICLFL